MHGVRSPGDLYQKIKRNALDGDENIVDAFEGAGKYCTFRHPDGHKCGKSLGHPVRVLLLGEDKSLATELRVQGSGAFFEGFAEGLIGDADGVKHCSKDLSTVGQAGMSLVNHALNHNVNKTVVDLQRVILAFQSSIADCKSAASELKPFLSVMHGVRSPGDLYQKIKRNALDGDENIVDAFEGAGKYCTFRHPDGHKCGKSLGHPVRVLLLGEDKSLATELSVQGPGRFVLGFARGLLGETHDVMNCGTDLNGVASAGSRLVHHLAKFNISRMLDDVLRVLHAFEASVHDCRKASKSLKPFLSTLKGVRSPADLMKKLKRNGLDNDEAVVDAFEDASKYCTFRKPDGFKCGESLGAPIRLILVGKPKVASDSIVLV